MIYHSCELCLYSQIPLPKPFSNHLSIVSNSYPAPKYPKDFTSTTTTENQESQTTLFGMENPGKYRFGQHRKHAGLDNLTKTTVKDVSGVIKALAQGSPREQGDALNRYFTPSASFVHPFCRVPHFDTIYVPAFGFLDSRKLIQYIYKWYGVFLFFVVHRDVCKKRRLTEHLQVQDPKSHN